MELCEIELFWYLTVYKQYLYWIVRNFYQHDLIRREMIQKGWIRRKTKQSTYQPINDISIIEKEKRKKETIIR